MPEHLGGWVGAMAAVSAVTLALSALALPWLVVRWEPDHFLHPPPPVGWLSPLEVATRVLRNVLGATLVLAGLAMLVLPGQGVLTLLAGLALLDVPGKRRAELAILGQPTVRRAVDGLRARRGAAPLRLPGDPDPSAGG